MRYLSTETELLARELAALTGEPIAVAVHQSLAERLARERARRRDSSLVPTIGRIQRRVAQLPVFDSRPSDELLGYDDGGLPT